MKADVGIREKIVDYIVYSDLALHKDIAYLYDCSLECGKPELRALVAYHGGLSRFLEDWIFRQDSIDAWMSASDPIKELVETTIRWLTCFVAVNMFFKKYKNTMLATKDITLKPYKLYTTYDYDFEGWALRAEYVVERDDKDPSRRGRSFLVDIKILPTTAGSMQDSMIGICFGDRDKHLTSYFVKLKDLKLDKLEQAFQGAGW